MMHLGATETESSTAWIGVAFIAAIVGAVFWLKSERAPDPRIADMARVEQLLLFHGYPVKGFAQTPAPDLELVDAIAPPGCHDVWRVAHLAQLAIVRVAPADMKSESGVIGAIAAIAYAQDIGRLDCVGLAPRRPAS